MNCTQTRAQTLGVIAVALSTAAAPVAAQETRFITVGTGGPTGVYFVVGNSVCRMVHKEAAEGRTEGRQHGLRCSAPSTAGSTYNIGQICAGELDFGVAQSDWQYHAYNGSAPDRVNACPDLRAVFSVHPEPYQILAAKDSGIMSWNDLKGKRFNIGNPGSGQRGTTEELIEGHGWTLDDFAVATELTSTEQASALCDGNIDAFGYTVGVPNAGVAVATDGCDAYIVDMGEDPVAQELVAQHDYYAFNTIPAGTYFTTDKDVTTFGVMATFVTSASVPDDVVYEVTRAVFENLDDFRSLHPAFANLDPAKMTTDALSAPIHPGAQRYYDEMGW
ncbi:TAXI family TRAP transporter solute-binding subunit [Defluviimonas sp. WL0002]|uniref:TAXI family TRAP transporter solute-binding subunit n=1 Tax=Albidovulum marisflavi TaxID=2984159 RepID=A0ABT2ZCJ9_9RHOB|nr:TAXI family TRAP transporter solute-binding subunit [Defluviimonas sp. WL0002]MCV2868875.1 TAXI family TRAP transporter solute-binding subunit [Defluviimonas sp. WL0002]